MGGERIRGNVARMKRRLGGAQCGNTFADGPAGPGLRYGAHGAPSLHPGYKLAVRDHAAKPRLLGAFSHVGLSIDDLQIRQAPEAEQ